MGGGSLEAVDQDYLESEFKLRKRPNYLKRNL